MGTLQHLVWYSSCRDRATMVRRMAHVRRIALPASCPAVKCRVPDSSALLTRTITFSLPCCLQAVLPVQCRLCSYLMQEYCTCSMQTTRMCLMSGSILTWPQLPTGCPPVHIGPPAGSRSHRLHIAHTHLRPPHLIRQVLPGVLDFELCLAGMSHFKPLSDACSRQSHALSWLPQSLAPGTTCQALQLRRGAIEEQMLSTSAGIFI